MEHKLLTGRYRYLTVARAGQEFCLESNLCDSALHEASERRAGKQLLHINQATLKILMRLLVIRCFLSYTSGCDIARVRDFALYLKLSQGICLNDSWSWYSDSRYSRWRSCHFWARSFKAVSHLVRRLPRICREGMEEDLDGDKDDEETRSVEIVEEEEGGKDFLRHTSSSHVHHETDGYH